MPYFSIITPTYNRPESLDRAIASVLKQTFSDFELIIVNNGAERIQITFKDDRIKILTQKKKGANYARNTGIENAAGNFICFLDDDDEYLDNHLQKLFDLIKENKETVALYRTYTKIEIAKNKFQDQPIVLLKHGESRMEHLYTILLFMACVCCHRNIFEEIKFDPSIPVAQDYHMWTRILISFPMIETPVITTLYHKTSNSTSSPSINTYLNYIDVLESLFSEGVVKAAIKSKTRNLRVFRYYYFILSDFNKSLSFIQFFKFSFSAFKYNPAYFFSFQYLKLVFKFFLFKFRIIK